MKRLSTGYILVLCALCVAAGYLFTLTLTTDLQQLFEARQRVTQMLNIQSRLQQLLFNGRQQEILSNSAVHDELLRLANASTGFQQVAQTVSSDANSPTSQVARKLQEQFDAESIRIESFLTNDIQFRNAHYYIESTSRQLADSTACNENAEFFSEAFSLRSKLASAWADGNFGTDAIQELLAQIEELNALAKDTKTRETISLLETHLRKASELQPLVSSLKDGVHASLFIDSLNEASLIFTQSIARETAKTKLATNGFAAIVASLIAFVITLLWDLRCQAKHLETMNRSLESKVKVEALKIRRVEESLFRSRKLESIGILAAGIAHEINTPMQCVYSNIEYLKGFGERMNNVLGTLRESLYLEEMEASLDHKAYIDSLFVKTKFDRIYNDAASAIDDTAEACQRVIEIVRAMKSMAHPGTENKVRTDINEVIRSAATISRSQWKETAELTFDLDEKLNDVECHPGEMSQVMLNLIVNASHAIIAKNDSALGKIHIQTKLENGGARIAVSDDGCGIPENIQRKIFDPFFTTKEVGKGTGQGLAITHDVIVNRHSGNIKVDSTVGKGTTLAVWIPCIAEKQTFESATQVQ